MRQRVPGLVYRLCGVPVFTGADGGVGAGQANAAGHHIGSFMATFGPVYGRLVGYGLLACITIAGGYYLVVIGNVFYSGYHSIMHGFSAQTTPAFKAGLGDHYLQLFLRCLSCWLPPSHPSCVRRGIEYVSNLFVPFFFLVSFYLVYSTEPAGRHCTPVCIPAGGFQQDRVYRGLCRHGPGLFLIGLGGTLTLI